MMMNNDSSKSIEKARVENKKYLHASALEMIRAGNDLATHASGTLISIATFLFIISSPFINFFSSQNKDSITLKVLLFISWALILTSVVLGLIQILIDFIFFDKEINALGKRITLFSQPILSEGQESIVLQEDEKIRNETKGHSSHITLLLQATFVLAGFILILITASLMLFK